MTRTGSVAHQLKMHQKILILDFGSQVTQLIARRIREAHVFCEVHPCDVSEEWVRAYARDGKLKGIIEWDGGKQAVDATVQ